MDTQRSQRLSGGLFIAAGVAFLVAGMTGEQPAFYGLFAAFVAIGAAYLRKGSPGD